MQRIVVPILVLFCAVSAVFVPDALAEPGGRVDPAHADAGAAAAEHVAAPTQAQPQAAAAAVVVDVADLPAAPVSTVPSLPEPPGLLVQILESAWKAIVPIALMFAGLFAKQKTSEIADDRLRALARVAVQAIEEAAAAELLRPIPKRLSSAEKRKRAIELLRKNGAGGSDERLAMLLDSALVDSGWGMGAAFKARHAAHAASA